MNFSYSQPSGWKKGDIRIWTKPLNTIPTGWQLCDGTNGTPSLVDRAIVGAGNKYQPNDTFGHESTTPLISVQDHTLSEAEIPSHRHNLGNTGSNGYTRYGAGRLYTVAVNGGWQYVNQRQWTQTIGSSAAHNHGAHSDAVDVHQPSTAVYWIMKVK